MRIHLLQHVPYEGPGRIAGWTAVRGIPLTVVRRFAGDPLPDADPDDLLVIMGGPMGALDDAAHPWLAQERAWIGRAVRDNRRVLGVCLGAQLMAGALGAEVTRNPEREIGHFPVRLTPDGARHPLLAGFPAAFTAFHWHGDTFGIPAGATHLAESDACAHQAFAFGGRAIGLQFHLEAGWAEVSGLIEHGAAELKPGAHVQSAARLAELARTGELFAVQQILLFRLLDRLSAA